MIFKAAIFDLDGTLVDSFESWEKAYKKVLKAAGHDLTSEEFLELYHMTFDESRDYFRALNKAGKIEIPCAPRQTGGSDAPDSESRPEAPRQTGGSGAPYAAVPPFTDIVDAFTREVFDDIRKEMKTLYATEAPGKPHALEYVKSLREKGVSICVATLTGAALSGPSLIKTGFMPYLNFIITSDDVGVSKKFPDIFLEAAKRLCAAPRETAVFEDCPTAIKTARDAGFKVCWVEDRHRVYDVPEVSRYCDWRVTDFRAAPDPNL